VAVFLAIGAVTIALRICLWPAPSGESCINNLRQIEGATEQWALEQHKTTNDTPSWEEVCVHLKGGRPACPEGGTYTLGRLGTSPRCSHPKHRLPY
jgi:hypothetical protein